MSIPQILNPQRDFSAGEIDISAIRRDDADVHKAAARKMLNCETFLAGGFGRRPGFRFLFEGGQYMDRIEPVSGTVFDIEFRAGQFRARNVDTGALQIITLAPWTAAQLADLDWAFYAPDLTLIVVAQTMAPQTITYNPATLQWTLAAFAFSTGLNGMLRQPFYRFATKGVTMQPASKASAASGTATFSAGVLNSGMVGNEFRWAGRRTKMTAFLTNSTATFLNLEELPPSFRTVLSAPGAAGYRVGDVVEGATNGSVGQIVAINTGTPSIDTVNTERYQGFTNGENVVASEASAQASGASSLQSPFATPQWDEAFMSDYRGWPGSVNVDRQRLIFADFAQLPGAFLESAIGVYNDFEITGDADGAIFEIVPQQERVLFVMGGADQFIFTTNNIYYVPISADNPLAPGSMEFRVIGTGGCGAIKPAASLSSLIYMSFDNKRLMALKQTGQTSQPYELDHLSRYHSGLIKSPVDVAISYGQDNTVDSNETLYVINGDGTVSRGRYDAKGDFVGFVPWSTQGRILGVYTYQRSVVFVVERVMASSSIMVTVEELDYSQTLDCVIETTTRQGGADLAPFVGESLHRFVDGLYTGPVLIGAGGIVAGATGMADTKFGYNYEPHFQPFAANFGGGQSGGQRLRRRKINRYAITVQDSGPFKVKDRDLAGYRVGDNFSLPPPMRNSTYTGSIQGRSYDPTFDLTQPVPYPLKIVEVGMEVTS